MPASSQSRRAKHFLLQELEIVIDHKLSFPVFVRARSCAAAALVVADLEIFIESPDRVVDVDGWDSVDYRCCGLPVNSPRSWFQEWLPRSYQPVREQSRVNVLSRCPDLALVLVSSY